MRVSPVEHGAKILGLSGRACHRARGFEAIRLRRYSAGGRRARSGRCSPPPAPGSFRGIFSTMTDKRQITAFLEENECQQLKQLKDELGLTWGGMMVNADFGHLRNGGTVVSGDVEVEVAAGGEAP